MTSSPESSDEQRGDWVSQRAVAWVIDDAPVPADLAWTLLVIARRCDKDGKGSFQTIATIAEKSGKSIKQAQRDVVKLRKLGLIVLGDQSLVAHLPPGKRPVVYDVPLDVKGSKPSKESRNKSGLKKGEVDSPPFDGTPPLQGTPPMDGGSTPPLQGVPRPPMEGGQKNPMNNPLEEPQKRKMPAKRASRRRADEEGWRILTEERGYNPEQARYLLDALNHNHKIYAPGWWEETHANGSLDIRIQEVIDAYHREHPAAAQPEAA